MNKVSRLIKTMHNQTSIRFSYQMLNFDVSIISTIEILRLGKIRRKESCYGV